MTAPVRLSVRGQTYVATVAVADAIHLLIAVRDELRRGLDNRPCRRMT